MKTWIIYGLILIMFISGCACSEMAKVVCDNVEEKDHCWQKVAISTKNPALCEKIEEAAPKSKCYLLLAISMKDSTLCKKMPTGAWAYKEDECWYNVAKETGVKSFCDNIMWGGDGTDITPLGYDKESCYEAAEERLKEKEKDCGHKDAPCCENSACYDSSVCKEDICVYECGIIGRECCENHVCNEGKCTVFNQCEAKCGGESEMPCAENKCNEFLNPEGGQCWPCGGDGKECCTQGIKCKESLMCNTAGICENSVCGYHARAPCAGKQCHENFVYNAQLDMCLDCGYTGLKCCAGQKVTKDYKTYTELKNCFVGECSEGMCS